MALVAFSALILAGSPPKAFADDGGPKFHGRSLSDAFSLAGNRAIRSRQPSTDARASGSRDRATSARYQPLRLSASACRGLSSFAVCGGTDALCTMSARVVGGQVFGGGARPTGCAPQQAAAAAAGAGPVPLPQVTPGLVLTALRRIGLPSAQARTQPEDKTLVNFATIFYARPASVTRTLTLLGQQVQVQATPRSFVWHYGDGTSSTTTGPGAPYPAKDVTHAYADAHVTVQTSVDVSYSGRFRVGRGGWQAIPGAVTIDGPTAPLRVSEATGVLSGSYQ